MRHAWWSGGTPSHLVLDEPLPGVAGIRIDRPERRNALSMDVRRELAAAFGAADEAESIRVVLLVGSDRCFAAGGDIRENARMGPVESIHRSYEKTALWGVVARCRKPIVAAVRGYALGGGAELMMLCDIVVASDSARIGQPEVKLGIVPGSGGTQRLPPAVGKYVAMKMLLTGEPFSGADAARAGLVSEAVPEETVEPRALEIAGRLASNAPLAVWFAKEAVLASENMALEAGLALESRASLALMDTNDFRVGADAFLQGVHPRFSGR